MHFLAVSRAAINCQEYAKYVPDGRKKLPFAQLLVTLARLRDSEALRLPGRLRRGDESATSGQVSYVCLKIPHNPH
jgi:hypothetical protein